MFRCSQCWNGSQKHKLHSTWQRFGRQVRDCERQGIRKCVSSKLEGLTDAELQVICFVSLSSGFPEWRGCLWTTHIVLQKTGYPAFLRWSVETVHIGLPTQVRHWSLESRRSSEEPGLCTGSAQCAFVVLFWSSFWNRVSMCISDLTGTHHIDQGGLRIPEISFPMLGIKVCVTTLGVNWYFFFFKEPRNRVKPTWC